MRGRHLLLLHLCRWQNKQPPLWTSLIKSASSCGVMYNTVGDTRGGAAVITQSAREHQHQHLLPAFQPSSIYISTYLNTYLHSILSFLKTWNLFKDWGWSLSKPCEKQCVYVSLFVTKVRPLQCNILSPYICWYTFDALQFNIFKVLRFRSFESRNWSTTEAFQENSSVPLPTAASS